MFTDAVMAAVFTDAVVATMVVFVVLFGVGFLALLVRCYQKVSQGQALIRNGIGGTRVSFSGMFVIPILHRVEYMDISVKRIEIDRRGE
jgi:flotillin